ncbi:MAG TPA: HIT domain-containing protein [Actinomycetota bacterium]|nr:HIT domain-containing protein [Actinomycetota bacterium]
MTERLWSPWRMAYVRGGGHAGEGCIFCDLPAESADHDQGNHLLARGELTFVLLNAFPYNPGHLMVAPYRHLGRYGELTAGELAEMMAFAGTAIGALEQDSGAHGFNLGMNLGQVAGAGIADHLHLHLVPRWGGDTNFMPIVGQTKVLPELLAETYQRLRPRFTGGDGSANVSG